MYRALEVQKQSNAPIAAQTLVTKDSKSRAVLPYVPGVKPPGWPLISALNHGTPECWDAEILKPGTHEK